MSVRLPLCVGHLAAAGLYAVGVVNLDHLHSRLVLPLAVGKTGRGGDPENQLPRDHLWCSALMAHVATYAAWLCH